MIQPLASQPALIDQVHDRLVAAIADGTLPPGERLTQECVAAMLGVSRQPVSHALQVLRMRGLAVETGKRGLVVAPLDARRLLELYEVRGVLEGLAAKIAAQRVRNGEASETGKKGLRDALQKGAELGKNADVKAMIDADVAFHAALHRLSGNSAIIEAVDAQWPHFMRAMGAVLADTDRRTRVWPEHGQIARLVLAGEPEQAEKATLDHIKHAAEATASGMKGRGPAGLEKATPSRMTNGGKDETGT